MDYLGVFHIVKSEASILDSIAVLACLACRPQLLFSLALIKFNMFNIHSSRFLS